MKFMKDRKIMKKTTKPFFMFFMSCLRASHAQIEITEAGEY